MMERHPRHQQHHHHVVTCVPHQTDVVTNKHANVHHAMTMTMMTMAMTQPHRPLVVEVVHQGLGVVRLVQNNAIAQSGHRISVVFILLRV